MNLSEIKQGVRENILSYPTVSTIAGAGSCLVAVSLITAGAYIAVLPLAALVSLIAYTVFSNFQTYQEMLLKENREGFASDEDRREAYQKYFLQEHPVQAAKEGVQNAARGFWAWLRS
ncbi:MAG: hypothetical protein WC371_00365 [Parachlamydiales bacterium]|jgi:hypothetical protein